MPAVTILTYGSRGDVQPYLALAVGLRRAGHAVRLAAPARFAAMAEAHGVAFAPLPGEPEELSRILNTARFNPLAQVRGMAGYVFSIAGAVAKAAFAACAGADLIVHSFLFTTGGHAMARKLGIPDVSLQTFPMFAPTAAFPNVAAARIPPGPLSYFSHWLATQVFWHGGNIGFQRLRRAEPEVFDLRLEWPFNLPAARRTPLLFAYSPLILPRPREWRAEHIHVCGYLFLDEVETYQPPPELAAFLAAGEPPVCVTFGSMISPEGGERAQAALHLGLERAGKRGLFLTGWGGTPTWGGARGEDSARWLHLPAAPHTWLLPRCQAVIHHGGAGTTAAGLRAGIPALVVPHAADQPFWGRRVAAIGAGLRPLPLDQLNPDAVAAALAQMDGAGMRARAAELGRLIRGEDGVSTAVRLIEARLETGG